jgi:hypothetical protein
METRWYPCAVVGCVWAAQAPNTLCHAHLGETRGPGPFVTIDETPWPDGECPPGSKLDGDKPRLDLLPVEALELAGLVLAHGAKKYSDDNWHQVPDGQKRYTAAALRHLFAHMRGEKDDPESGLPHIGHFLCCALFLTWYIQTGTGGAPDGDSAQEG